MDTRRITGGTKIYFGVPAKSLPPELISAIVGAIARVPGILEAHLPQCFIEGDTAAHQVLVLVTTADSEIPQVAGELHAGLTAVLPPGVFLDMLPFAQGRVPNGVREARCQIYPPNAVPH